jgi:dTDP-4-dehydrorhamnose 3,5-epimerase
MHIYSDKKLKEVKYFKVNTFKDFRGEIWTSWEKKYFKNINFNLDKFTTSKKNVLRGFHGDKKSWRLVTCPKGEVLNVIVDYRPNSKNYLKCSTFKLNDKNKISVLLPPMFLNSWLCLSKNALYAYKWSFKGRYVDADDQISVKWNDPRINFKWPIKKVILSKRDK